MDRPEELVVQRNSRAAAKFPAPSKSPVRKSRIKPGANARSSVAAVVLHPVRGLTEENPDNGKHSIRFHNRLRWLTAKHCKSRRRMVLRERIELSTSPLPRVCSTTELPQHSTGALAFGRAGGLLPQLAAECKRQSRDFRRISVVGTMFGIKVVDLRDRKTLPGVSSLSQPKKEI